MIDEETKYLAALALRNAFWDDFSDLVNKYLEASSGLDIAKQEELMGTMTDIYGRNPRSVGDATIGIWTKNGEGMFANSDHYTLLQALEHDPATKVYLQGRKVFERVDGVWHFLD